MKLQTLLRHFRFTSEAYTEVLRIDWYKYHLTSDAEQKITGFTMEELDHFKSFTLANNLNFEGGKNYHLIQNDELPELEYSDMITDQLLKFPSYLLLKPKADLYKGIGISLAMEIMLLDDKHKNNHHYNLPFGAIGRIL